MAGDRTLKWQERIIIDRSLTPTIVNMLGIGGNRVSILAARYLFICPTCEPVSAAFSNGR